MKLIPLTQGKFAKVDDGDFEWLNQWKWMAKESDKGHFYACKNEPRVVGEKRKLTRMHSLIMGHQEGKKIDHIDRDSLNNQRNNLRFATPAQNSANTSVRKTKNSTRFLGVFYKKCKWSYKRSDGTINSGIKEYWVTHMIVNGVKTKSYSFPPTHEGEIMAAKKYNELAYHYKGEFANLNYF